MSSGGQQADWEQVERVLAAARELSEEQRAAYLALQPAPVRAEVESLLAAHGRAGSFLEKGVQPFFAGGPTDLKPGLLIGAYRLEAIIGKGGMGVVYRALDTKLNRPAAVKFLFDDLADQAARRRFQREAQTASSLNHPHILTVYDTGEFEGRQYLITEFVDGGTLTDWVRVAPRTWREIVALLTGVADGLATAHAAGILHRDIKPDNILVGTNGYAKLSDFGLAKLQERTTPDDVTRSLSRGTQPGVILGTIAYMSPEQASGRATDARSDIFSFGILLYELLAGKRPFTGVSELEVLQGIIHAAAPPLTANVPLALRMVVEKALEKDPAERYQSARDMVVDLRRLGRQTVESAPGTTTAAAGPVAEKGKDRWKAIAVAALIALVLVPGGMLLMRAGRSNAPEPRQVVQFDLYAPPGILFTPPVNRQPFAISPDGRRLAFTATGGDGTHIWIRELASPELHRVPGADGAVSVFWPPDSRSLFYSTKLTLMQSNLETGSTRSLADLSGHAHTATWRPNGDVVLFLGGNDNFELRAGDSSPRKMSTTERIRWPQFLPGGNRVVYVTPDAATHGFRGMAADDIGKKPAPLMETDSRLQYAPPRRAGEPGYLLFMHRGNLLAQSFDADRLQLAGEAFPVAQNVIYYGPTLSASFSVSSNGILVYQAGFPTAELKWYDRAGKELGTVGRPATHWGNVRISRDGRRVAATVWDPEIGGAGIWIFDVNGRESRRLTFPPEVHRRPVWSPDGARLAFGGSRYAGGGPRLATLDLATNATVSEMAKDLPESDAKRLEGLPNLPTDWSKDGRLIAFDDGVGHEVMKAMIVDLAGHRVADLMDAKFPQWGIAFAPDGSRIAFVSTESGRPEVAVQALDTTSSPRVAGERRQVSRDGAWQVRWRADGRELYYLGMDNVMYAVPVKGPLDFGDPQALFRVAGPSQFGTTRDFQFDVSADGKRFIMPTTGSVPPPPFTVIENWQDKFRR